MTDQTTQAPADVSTMTPEAAQAEIDTLMGGSDAAKQFKIDLLRGDNLPANRAARERWNALHKVAGGKSVDHQGVQRDSGPVEAGERTASSHGGLNSAMEAAAQAPSSPEGYRLTVAPVNAPKDTPKEEVEAMVAAHGQAVSAFRNVAHAAQFSQSDFDTVVARFDNLTAGREGPMSQQESDAMYDATMTAMAREHGSQEAAMARIKLANSVLDALPPALKDQATRMLQASGLANDRWTIERLASIAERKGTKR